MMIHVSSGAPTDVMAIRTGTSSQPSPAHRRRNEGRDSGCSRESSSPREEMERPRRLPHRSSRGRCCRRNRGIRRPAAAAARLGWDTDTGVTEPSSSTPPVKAQSGGTERPRRAAWVATAMASPSDVPCRRVPTGATLHRRSHSCACPQRGRHGQAGLQPVRPARFRPETTPARPGLEQDLAHPMPAPGGSTTSASARAVSAASAPSGSVSVASGRAAAGTPGATAAGAATSGFAEPAPVLLGRIRLRLRNASSSAAQSGHRSAGSGARLRSITRHSAGDRSARGPRGVHRPRERRGGPPPHLHPRRSRPVISRYSMTPREKMSARASVSSTRRPAPAPCRQGCPWPPRPGPTRSSSSTRACRSPRRRQSPTRCCRPTGRSQDAGPDEDPILGVGDFDHFGEPRQRGLPIHSGTESRGQRAPCDEIHQQRRGLRNGQDVMDREDVEWRRRAWMRPPPTGVPEDPDGPRAAPSVRGGSKHGVADPVHRRSPASEQASTRWRPTMSLRSTLPPGRSVAGDGAEFWLTGAAAKPAAPGWNVRAAHHANESARGA